MGVAFGMSGAEDRVEALLEFCSTAAGVVLAACGVGEVALAFDVAVLQAVGPSAELAGAGFGEGFEI